MPARIIGIGQSMAGDDGVGIAVARRLGEMDVPDDINVMELAEPSEIIPFLIEGASPVVLVDAVVGASPPGRLIRLEAGTPELAKAKLLSSHGVGMFDAIELARTITTDPAAFRVVVIGIAIERPRRYGERLSPPVAAAVAPAAELALRIAKGES
ncbi:MAG: hydrogenase maturation protease [Candidatus Binataceae bacterium]